jgi:putative membrane protein
MMYWHMYPAWGWVFIVLVGIAFAVLAFFVIRALIRSEQSSQYMANPPAKGPTALEILKERYAKGEITQKEFQQMRKDLEQ